MVVLDSALRPFLLALSLLPFDFEGECIARKASFEGASWLHDSYLVDSASSHMLVSKIKPCMSKYKQFVL